MPEPRKVIIYKSYFQLLGVYNVIHIKHLHTVSYEIFSTQPVLIRKLGWLTLPVGERDIPESRFIYYIPSLDIFSVWSFKMPRHEPAKYPVHEPQIT